MAVADFFVRRMAESSDIPYKDGIRAESNLSSRVLREIVESLALDYSYYETKEKLLDEVLLRSRNSVAHGDFLSITREIYSDLHEEIVAMMEQFRTQIDNAAARRLYRVD